MYLSFISLTKVSALHCDIRNCSQYANALFILSVIIGNNKNGKK